MKDATYNGWTNYETWLANLWLTNDEGTYNLAVRTAGDALRHGDPPRIYLADHLAEIVKDMVGVGDEDVVSATPTQADFLRASLGRVDWREIAGGILESYSEELAAP